ncbi:DoxX family protein [Halovulum dunhuangense]|uniref:DoxX family protein n=1 Tax=Halovulum dunhuangense TaxID=1505036 RepID=A0A849L3N6_9RHOB|nr:DoxX family protein [Halovulum dunhuangense]NNU80771.1 DoxX family protein [Halovulum dunhuangense]
MTAVSTFAAPLGRFLLAFIFIFAGFGKLGDVQGTAGYIASGGLPGFLVYPTIALEIVGGLFILVGYQVRVTALLLAGFSLLSGFLYHYLPAQGMEGFAQMAEMNQFFKNVSIAGGFLLLTALGAGPLSVDNRNDGGTPARA